MDLASDGRFYRLEAELEPKSSAAECSVPAQHRGLDPDQPLDETEFGSLQPAAVYRRSWCRAAENQARTSGRAESPNAPLRRVQSSYLFRSASHSFLNNPDDDEASGPSTVMYPYTGAVEVAHKDITEDGFPPDQRAGPVSAHMHLVVSVKKGFHSPLTSKNGLFFEVSFLDQKRSQAFDLLTGCEDPFTFFVHERIMVEEEWAVADMETTRAITISCFTGTENGDMKSLGCATFGLKALLRQPRQGMDVRAVMVDENESTIAGVGGKAFYAVANFRLQPLESEKQDLQVRAVPPPHAPNLPSRPIRTQPQQRQDLQALSEPPPYSRAGARPITSRGPGGQGVGIQKGACVEMGGNTKRGRAWRRGRTWRAGVGLQTPAL